MTRDEIVAALRCHCEAIETGRCPKDKCPSFERPARYKCAGAVAGEAADLIENQQRHIEALMQANAALRDTVLRRDAQIADMSQGLAQFARAVAVRRSDGNFENCFPAADGSRCAGQFGGKYRQQGGLGYQFAMAGRVPAVYRADGAEFELRGE